MYSLVARIPFKGTVRPDWICMRVVQYYWIGLEKYINRLRFLIFDFWSWIFDFKEFKVLSRFMQKWIQPPACLDHGLHVLKPRFFLPNYAPKRQERYQLFFGSKVRNSNILQSKQNRAALWWRMFSSNKSAPASRKTGFYASRDPKKQEVGLIFTWSNSELWSLFKYSRVKFKNQNSLVVDVLFKAYPIVPLLMQIQSGQTVPLKWSEWSEQQGGPI